MAEVVFWVDRVLEFLRLRGPAQPTRPAELAPRDPLNPRIRAHGLPRRSRKPKKEVAR